MQKFIAPSCRHGAAFKQLDEIPTNKLILRNHNWLIVSKSLLSNFEFVKQTNQPTLSRY